MLLRHVLPHPLHLAGCSLLLETKRDRQPSRKSWGLHTAKIPCAGSPNPTLYAHVVCSASSAITPPLPGKCLFGDPKTRGPGSIPVKPFPPHFLPQTRSYWFLLLGSKSTLHMLFMMAILIIWSPFSSQELAQSGEQVLYIFETPAQCLTHRGGFVNRHVLT